MKHTLVFDVEAVAIDDAQHYLEPVSAPSNYTKPDAIAKYVERATSELLAKCALDVDLARIVAIGSKEDDAPAEVWTCKNDDAEIAALVHFWQLVGVDYNRPRLIGYNVIGYDLPLLMRRSLYLGVPHPQIQIGKYRHPDVDDLMLILSNDGALKFRGLGFYAKRLGLAVPDDLYRGADVAALIAAGDYAAVADHCLADVETTAALARRIGYLSAPVSQAVGF